MVSFHQALPPYNGPVATRSLFVILILDPVFYFGQSVRTRAASSNNAVNIYHSACSEIMFLHISARAMCETYVFIFLSSLGKYTSIIIKINEPLKRFPRTINNRDSPYTRKYLNTIVFEFRESRKDIVSGQGERNRSKYLNTRNIDIQSNDSYIFLLVLFEKWNYVTAPFRWRNRVRLK